MVLLNRWRNELKGDQLTKVHPEHVCENYLRVCGQPVVFVVSGIMYLYMVDCCWHGHWCADDGTERESVQQSSAAPTDDEPEDLHTAAFASSVEPQQTTANRQTGDDDDNDDSSNSSNPFNDNLHRKTKVNCYQKKTFSHSLIFYIFSNMCN